MNRLSSDIEEIDGEYDVVVVGSGYGGAIMASRLARAGMKVCVLERGRERQPGEYPNTALEAVADMQMNLPEVGHEGSRTGLFDLHVNKDIGVLVGCGLGGTSLINANVSIRAEPRVFDDPRWPAELRGEKMEHLNTGYRLAERMLSPNPYPESYPPLPKLTALQRSAEVMGQPFRRTNINVTFKDGINAAGVAQKACNNCGDCCSGCNYGSKNTVLMNYLPDAKRHGAHIFVEVSVRHVERRSDGKWNVHYQVLDTGREAFDAPTLVVTASIVVLSAGTLGSTEILLRSKELGLPLSDQLGQGFSGNGDMLGFGYNCTPKLEGIGFGHRAVSATSPVGPCITGVIDMRNQADIKDDIIIEEGAIPGALAPLLPLMFKVASCTGGSNTAPQNAVAQGVREAESLLLGAYHGATMHTQTYLVMGHEANCGTMKLERDQLRIDWPQVGTEPIFEKMNARLFETTAPLEGIAVKDPIWSPKVGDKLITVHPLGGCMMADSAESGVVNHKGTVFASSAGAAVHEGLYVCDGSIVPVSLGVNPLLTISALAERCAIHLARDRGLHIDYSDKGPIPPEPQTRKPGIRFTETMKGYFSKAVDSDFQTAADLGKQEDSNFKFILTIVSEDVDAMLASPEHEARTLGTVDAPALSGRPLTVTHGTFNLFVQDPDAADTRLMKYKMRMRSEEGRSFYFYGFKVIKDRPFWDAWHDTTTLYITIHEGEDETGPAIGKGILVIEPDDFIRQLGTLDVTNAKNAEERLATTVKFGRYFAGVVYDYYGGVAAPLEFADSNPPPEKRRPLRVPGPRFYPFKSGDGVDLLLTRYQGGSKGPVMLAHGLGVSSRIFSTDTIETNLLEHLVAHGYDVWLLDFRSSVLLPASKTQYTADQIALYDHPAAVAKVREATGAAGVQVVAHCYGATTFTMAMLAGLKGVRSAVISQISTHVVTPAMVHLKAGLHAPSVLDALGVESLTTNASSHEGFFSRLYDRALALYPVGDGEHCNSAVCHRISFMYSLLYEHAQLNFATHERLYELFGEATMRAFEGLALMTRKGHVVDAEGKDVYLPHLDRMAIPIRFIHGAENQCFLPASTEKTVEVLSARNGAGLYSRNVIPGYGHIDCIFGKSASTDVYPFMVEHLDRT
ncbi:alpha/beta fold hydrolase [Sorangium sp. So ce542]|uniref:alpha/beta fold hydrolase n=1 Tax=Sorangium sp. So ce542 TaxID=3133316 RepID=UPI003F5EB097